MGDLIRVLVVDSREAVRAGLVAVLSRASDVVVAGQAGDREDVAVLCARHRARVVVLAGQWPEEGVAEVIRRCPGVGVLVLDRACDRERLRRLLEVKRAGYGLETDDLLQAVRAMAHAGWWISPAAAKELAAALPRRVNVDLTERERAVLRHVIAGERDREIAQAMNLSERRVQTHLGRVFDKLGVRSRAGAAASAVAWGLMQGPAEDDHASARESAAESAGKHIARRRKP